MIKKRQIYIYLLIFSIISVTTIYSSIAINHEQNTYIKQLIWYIVSFGLIFTITKIKNSFIISENKPENRKIIYKVIS